MKKLTEKSKPTRLEDKKRSVKKNHNPVSKRKFQAIDLAICAYDAAVEQKSLDVIGLNVSEITTITEYVVIASGTSERHTKGIAEKIELHLSKLGEKPFSTSGQKVGEWIVLDYGNLVVHVFHEPVRQFYRLEELWQQATPINSSKEVEAAAKIYRTKTL